MPTSPSPDADDRATSLRAGFRAGVPYAVVGFLLSTSFGIVAGDAGFPAEATIVMSAIVFAGSAQFAAVTILASGGTAAAAIAAGALMNSRFLPMGIAIGPSMPGRAAWRAAQGQAVVDASWAMANRGDGTFDRWFLFGSTAPQYVMWLAGTIFGAVGGGLFEDPAKLGLDAIYPTFFLALLIAEVRNRTTFVVALSGGLIALALVEVAPAGIPVLAASLVAAWGLRRRPEAPA
ncbi:MAG: branched-chain amino acid permease [Aeromicrobium sp.]|nr:branched-chain amino acid permease [Aeromicrobium sp.]